ncbi:MAG: PrgI family protein [Patescibacteria group bacterium]
MPEQFVVPQFIDVEDKIIGPISARQFIILLVVLLTDTLLFKLLTFGKFLLVAIPFLIVGLVFAFVRVNGQPFHYFVLNIVKTFRKPQLRVWDKSLNDSEVRIFMKTEEELPPPLPPRKAAVTASRLAELTMVVNTGGVYNPEDYE